MNSCREKRKCFKNLCGDYQVLCRSGAGSKLVGADVDPPLFAGEVADLRVDWNCGEVAAARWHQGLRAGPDVVDFGVWPMPLDMAGVARQNGSSGSNSGGAWSGTSCSRQACCICGP